MKLTDTIKIAISGLTLHKPRSALTILGIVIGITAIILITALGQSAENLIISQIQSLGPKNIYILPGRQPKGFTNIAGTLFTDSLKIKDLEDLKQKSNVPDAMRIIPITFTYANVNYGPNNYNTMIVGSSEEVFDLVKLQLKEGDYFTKDDVVQKAEVALLGEKITKELFDNNSPVGEKVKIKNKNFRILGVLETKGQTAALAYDEAVIAPYTTVQQYLTGTKYFQRIVVEAASKETIPIVVKDVETVLRNNHNIKDPKDDDFNIQTEADLIKTLGSITDILTVLLTAVAAISLLVGGVGIMNIMLVSIAERTREIGLRKALGATNKNILYQFLTEAIILTLAGGLLGILIGSLFSLLTTLAINQMMALNFTFTFPIKGACWGLLVSALVGLIFGIYPAYQASKKSPMEALRYE